MKHAYVGCALWGDEHWKYSNKWVGQSSTTGLRKQSSNCVALRNVHIFFAEWCSCLFPHFPKGFEPENNIFCCPSQVKAQGLSVRSKVVCITMNQFASSYFRPLHGICLAKKTAAQCATLVRCSWHRCSQRRAAFANNKVAVDRDGDGWFDTKAKKCEKAPVDVFGESSLHLDGRNIDYESIRNVFSCYCTLRNSSLTKGHVISRALVYITLCVPSGHRVNCSMKIEKTQFIVQKLSGNHPTRSDGLFEPFEPCTSMFDEFGQGLKYNQLSLHHY